MAEVTINAILKYTREVTVGMAFKAALAANWLGVDPLSITNPHWLAMNPKTV